MNHYTRALAELKSQTAHKLGEVGDQWQTPPALFWGINAVFGPFLIDLFTDGENSKCPRFYTAENNALLQDWAKDLAGGKAFANPPYSRSSYDDDKNAITGMRNIMAKVMAEREKGARIVLLLKSATSEVWWPEQADHVAFVRGRISFDLPGWFIPASDKDKSSAAGFAVAICVFDKEWRGQPMQYIERESLLAQGSAIIYMIEQRASELAQQYATATLEQTELSGNSEELAATKCVEESGTHANDGTKTLTIHTVEYTSEEIADQLTSGKLPFTGDHLALMLQLDGMFGKQYSYSTSQIRAAILAFDEPGMVTKGGEVVAAVVQVDDTNVVELAATQITEQATHITEQATEIAEEQNDLFEHFDAAMSAGTEPVPEPEAEPEPAPAADAALPAQSDDAEIYFDALGIPQNLREIGKKCDQADIERSGHAIWAKGRFAAGKLNGIGIRSGGDFKKGYMYEPVLVVYHNGQATAQHSSWPAALAELKRLLRETASAAVPMGAEHPFFTGFYNGHACYEQTVKGKLERVKNFTLEQCQIALNIPLSHNSVRSAIETRIRKLQKEQAAA